MCWPKNFQRANNPFTKLLFTKLYLFILELNISFLDSSFSSEDDDSSLTPTSKQTKPGDDPSNPKATRSFVSASSSSLGKDYILKKLGKSNSVAKLSGLGNSVSASTPTSKQPPITVNENISKSMIRFKRTLSRSVDELSHYVESKGDHSRNDSGIIRSRESSDTDTTTSNSCSSNSKDKFLK